MEFHDLQPLLKSNNTSISDSNLPSSSTRTPNSRPRRRNSLTMASFRRYRCLMLFLIGAIILAGFSFLYRCPDYYCFAQKPSYTIAPPPAPLQLDIEFISYDTIQHENFEFNINGSDVIVFLHVQKTGGTTFEKHLVNDIDLESPCLCRRKPKKHRKKHNHNHQRNNNNNKSQRRSLMAMTADLENNQRKKRKLKCDCFRPNGKMSNWLFSRYNIGWKCGLHPDWTELTECVDDKLNSIDNTIMRRRYFYITMLRDPVRRYLSEFKHTQRGATWKGSIHMCNGQPASRAEIPPCYDDLNYDDWSDVSLQEFMNCSSNLANNRQTRMLADLRLVHCYNTSFMSSKARDMIMLNSAKTNLEKMAYFGLTEKQHESQILFQHVFDLQFKTSFKQNSETTSSNAQSDLDKSVIDKITELNHLDVDLYEFAKKLFDERFAEINEI